MIYYTESGEAIPTLSRYSPTHTQAILGSGFEVPWRRVDDPDALWLTVVQNHGEVLVDDVFLALSRFLHVEVANNSVKLHTLSRLCILDVLKQCGHLCCGIHFCSFARLLVHDRGGLERNPDTDGLADTFCVRRHDVLRVSLDDGRQELPSTIAFYERFGGLVDGWCVDLDDCHESLPTVSSCR